MELKIFFITDKAPIIKEVSDKLHEAKLITVKLLNTSEKDDILSIHLNNRCVYLKEIYLLAVDLDMDEDEDDMEGNNFNIESIELLKPVLNNGEIDILYCKMKYNIDKYIGKPYSKLLAKNIEEYDITISDPFVEDIYETDKIQDLGWVPKLRTFILSDVDLIKLYYV